MADSTIEVLKDVVSDPLKHLLSLDWNSSITLTGIENNLEPTKSVKRVRFSDEVEKISYDFFDDVKKYDTSLCHEENNDDRNHDSEITADLATPFNESSVNETNVFTENTECTNLEYPFNDGANMVDSIVNNSLIDPSTEILMTVPEKENSVIQNTNQTDFLLINNYENNQLNYSNDLKELASDFNEITDQVQNLSLENELLQNKNSLSLDKPDAKPTGSNMLFIETSIDELKLNTIDSSSITSKKRQNNKLYSQKQSWKLNSVLTVENLCYSSASELNSAVFKAWCEVKSKTKSVVTAVSNEKNVPHRHTNTNTAHSMWKKSKTKALKKTKKDKSRLDFPNINQENSKNSKEEIEMAFKAWKKKKDEMLKQKISEKFDKEQEKIVESLMEKRGKKMEAESAFNSWKQHKSHVLKIEKNKKAWVLQKKKEEEERKIARDREALTVYHMWLENKNFVKHESFSPKKTKEPWTPPGK